MRDDFTYDNTLFDSKEDNVRKPTWRDKLKRFLRIIIALLALIGIIYISGIYQMFVYKRTSSGITQTSVKSITNAEQLTISLRVYVLTNNEIWGSERSKEEVLKLLSNAEAIWDQAEIGFDIKEIKFQETPDKDIRILFNNPSAYVKMLSDYDQDYLNIFLARSLRGINGVAYLGLESAVVADYTTVFDFRVLAHEIGHLLSLEHVPRDYHRLMFQGANGTKLTIDEVKKAREKARDFSK